LKKSPAYRLCPVTDFLQHPWRRDVRNDWSRFTQVEQLESEPGWSEVDSDQMLPRIEIAGWESWQSSWQRSSKVREI
jgi:hypothetical protein